MNWKIQRTDNGWWLFQGGTTGAWWHVYGSSLGQWHALFPTLDEVFQRIKEKEQS
jgi:hypothetical protein